MSGTNTPNCDNPPILSLVVQSKKALQHGEQLCLRAHEVSRGSTQVAAELLALNAKIQWIAQGLAEQLKIVNGVSKSIDIRRQELLNRAKQYDKSRSFHTGNLDRMLEQLEAQVVPPDFHHSATSDASSLFGSPQSDDEERREIGHRGRWKTLRDFVHERAIVDAIENMDKDRNELDDILAVTEGYPQLLNDSVSSFRGSLPVVANLPPIRELFESQERVTIDMAHQLESLAKHFEQMEASLHDHEAGAHFSEDDLVEMNRDAEELPLIIGDLEDGVKLIQANFDTLSEAKTVWQGHLHEYQLALNRLDNIGDAMSSMVEQQASVAADFEEHLAPLQEHIDALEKLYLTYKSYQLSYNKLVLEMERRRRYRDTATDIVQTMLRQLTDLREEELRKRDEFFAEHGEVLPQDLCVCIGDEPTKWTIAPENAGSVEELPEIDGALLAQAMKFLDSMKENGKPP